MDNTLHYNQERFFFWTPPERFSIEIGAERELLNLPRIALPLLQRVDQDAAPDRVAIGEGLITFLRQDPDCELGPNYVQLLEQAFPYLLSDLAAQTVMLEQKEVDPAFLQRKLNALKIFALLQPGNAAMQRQIGLAAYGMAMEIPLFGRCQELLLQGHNHLRQACRLKPDEAAGWNELGQVNYLLGDYSLAVEGFARAAELLGRHPAAEQLRQKIAAINAGEVPQPPLAQQLEQAGEGLALVARGETCAGRELLEELDRKSLFTKDFPSPEILQQLAEAQARNGAKELAAATLLRCLEVDPGYQPAQQCLEKIRTGEELP